MHPDQKPYLRFTGRSRLDKAINSLLGIIEGVAIDGVITPMELEFLQLWLSQHDEWRELHPFNELYPVVESAIADRLLTEGERDDLVWLCERLTSTEYYDQVTADLQRLHAVLGGIIADCEITEAELRGLSDWLDAHDHLRSCWPYDELGALITYVLRDKKIDAEEHKLLHAFFSEFIALFDGRTITRSLVSEGTMISGLCAVCPEITFADKNFCFTGLSPGYTRDQLSESVRMRGGEALDNLSNKVHFLVIGSKGNQCWAFACYGRKVEKAVEMRKSGHRVMIVHESDFHDAVADHPMA